MNIWAFVPAGGSGRRMGAEIPKQYLALAGKPVILHAVERLRAHPAVRGIAVGIAADDPHWASLNTNVDLVTCAGAERVDTVFEGLGCLARQADDVDWVLVHDAARPLLRRTDLDRLIVSAPAYGGGLLANPVTDTIKQADAAGRVEATLDRSTVWRAATPQLFPLRPLLGWIEQALSSGLGVTDESAAAEAAGERPLLVACAADNIKITQPGDLALAEWLLSRQESS